MGGVGSTVNASVRTGNADPQLQNISFRIGRAVAGMVLEILQQPIGAVAQQITSSPIEEGLIFPRISAFGAGSGDGRALETFGIAVQTLEFPRRYGLVIGGSGASLHTEVSGRHEQVSRHACSARCETAAGNAVGDTVGDHDPNIADPTICASWRVGQI